MNFYILAIRSSASVLGGATAIAKIDGKPAFFETREEAQIACDRMQAQIKSPNVSYQVRED